MPLPTDNSITKEALTTIYNVNATFYDKLPSDAGLDTPIYQINQAALGAWYQANNMPFWRIALTVCCVFLDINYNILFIDPLLCGSRWSWKTGGSVICLDSNDNSSHWRNVI
jgi:hypothetical protein